MERAFRRQIYRIKEHSKRGITPLLVLAYLTGGFLIGVIVPVVILFFIYSLYSPQLPDPRVLEDYTPALVTRVYSIDHEVLAEFAGEKRIWVPVSDVSPNIINAVLAAEDHRFYSHWGVNTWAILRAFYVNIRTGRRAQGGSTITQQLTRSLFLTREKLITRKIREALTALKMERSYSKEEILELFLNQQYLGKGCYGVEAASRFFFGKRASEVDIKEAATLAGLLQAPSRYINDPEKLTARRNTVLRQMAANEMIDPNTCDSLSAEPLNIKVDEEAAVWKAPYFIEYIRLYIEQKYGDSYLYERGISIYTTLDWKMQQHAESVFVNQIDKLERWQRKIHEEDDPDYTCLLYTSPSPRDLSTSRMPSSA